MDPQHCCQIFARNYAFSSAADPDPYTNSYLGAGSGSALEMGIPDPDPAAIKLQKNRKIINICLIPFFFI